MDNKTLNKSFPTYNNDKKIMIGGWDSPINTLADYQMAKDMSLTTMFVDQVYAKMGTEDFVKTLQYCEQVGLEAILTIGNCGEQETARSVLENDATDYSQYPAVKAINYWDEPFYENFDRVEELFDLHVAKYGDKIAFYINHFPNTAIGAFGGLNYEQFIREYSERILSKCAEGKRYLSADIYPLETKNGVNIIRSNWLGCIETVAMEGKRSNATTHFFLLSTPHHTSEDITYREVKEEDLRYQFFVNMAFGIQAFSYFTYRGEVACVRGDVSCSPNERYSYAKKVNEEIQSLAPTYLSFTWNGTLPLLGENNKSGKNENFDGLSNVLNEVECLKKVAASEDTLVGQFKDKDGNDGLIVTNFTDPYYEIQDKVTLTFKNANRVRFYYKGGYQDYILKNNTFEFLLKPGDGAFLIPMGE